MGTLVFQATLGGSVNLIGPNIAGTVNFTLPSADGTSGQALATNGSGTLAFSSFATLTSNTFSGSQTLSAGTANGVTYLNGSKVLTSGSALTFDGTNLGLGVTPSAWRTAGGEKVFQFDNGSVYCNSGNDVYLNSNWYLNSSSQNIYIESDYATSYAQANGAHIWYTAPSGTAGNAISFTQAMTLDASGYLMVGTTTSNSAKLTLSNAGAESIQFYPASATNNNQTLHYNRSTSTYCTNGMYAADHRFFIGGSEVSRIDSSGNLLVGTTTAVGKFCVTFNGSVENGTVYRLTANSSGAGYVYYQDNAANTCGSVVRVGTTSAVVFGTTSDYRLKTVTSSVTGHGQRIDALKPIDYLWTEGGQQARGFLAHEFQTVYPNSVTGDKDAVDADGNPVYQSMQAGTAEVIADLVAEIQSLRQRLAAANL